MQHFTLWLYRLAAVLTFIDGACIATPMPWVNMFITAVVFGIASRRIWELAPIISEVK